MDRNRLLEKNEIKETCRKVNRYWGWGIGKGGVKQCEERPNRVGGWKAGASQ